MVAQHNINFMLNGLHIHLKIGMKPQESKFKSQSVNNLLGRELKTAQEVANDYGQAPLEIKASRDTHATVAPLSLANVPHRGARPTKDDDSCGDGGMIIMSRDSSNFKLDEGNFADVTTAKDGNRSIFRTRNNSP